jgi:predicted nucleic acid-binding protein
MSADRFFLDTNIFVYEFDPRFPAKRQKASGLIQIAAATHRGRISYQVVQEFIHCALEKFIVRMTPLEASAYLADVLEPMLTVQSSAALCNKALRLRESTNVHWYDALIVAGAIEAGCAILYSEDFQHGQQFGNLRVVNPFV